MAQMNRQQQHALGSGFGDQCFTAEIDDDEIDQLNDETFGIEGDLGDEWEFEKMAEQTELATTKTTQIVYRTERNAEEMLEESLTQLVDDDDDHVISDGRKPKQPNLNGTQPTSFVQTNFANLWSPMQGQDDIWGFGQSPTKTAPRLPIPDQCLVEVEHTRIPQLNGASLHNTSEPKENGTQSLNVLLNAMRFHEKVPGASMGLKGAKTVEELEDEMKSVQAALNCADQSNPAKRPVPTCEDIEREMKNALLTSPSVKGASGPAVPNSPFPPMGMFGLPPPPGALPPGFPPLPPPLPPGGIPPSLMANPQFRAALMTELVRRQMALRCGSPLPPVPPPSFPGSPGVPTGIHLPPPMSDPAHLPPFVRQQIMQNIQRQNNLRGRRLPFTGGFDRHGPNDRDHRNQRDPYAGFMSKREKEWLIKLQMLQLMVNNPYVDDYYSTMYESNKAAKQQEADGNPERTVSMREKDKDENDNNSHAYVPPTFEGSLGKVQYLSATCPRQLIDVSSQPSTTGDDSPTPSTSDSKTPPIGVLNVHSNLKRHREVLIEIENLYNLLLELEDLQRQTPATTENEKEKRDKMNHLEMSFVSERLATILAVRKGRSLFARFLRHADSDQVVSMLKALIGQMPAIVIKERTSELYDILYDTVAQAVTKLDGTELSTAADSLDIGLAEGILKSKFMYALWLLIVQKSSAVPGFTGNLLKEKVQLWATLAAECRKFRIRDWLSESDQLVLSGYLEQCDVDLATVDQLMSLSLD